MAKKREFVEIELPPTAIHGQLPWNLIQTALPSRAKLLFPVLWAFAFARKSPEVDELATASSLSRSTVKRAAHDLDRSGWLKIEKRHNYPNKFVLSENVSAGPGGSAHGKKGVLTVHHEPSTVHHEPSTVHHEPSTVHGGPPTPKRENRDWRGGFAGPPLPLPPQASPFTIPKAPPKRSRKGLNGSEGVGAAFVPPAGWEGWKDLVAAKTGKPWAWSKSNREAVAELSELVPPGALQGWQLNFIESTYAASRGWDLRIGLEDVNKLMPRISPPKKKLVQMQLPEVEPVDLSKADPKILAAFGMTGEVRS